MIKEHDQVVLTKNLPALGLEQGDIGIVVHINSDGKAYEVEFMTLEGKTIGVSTLELTEVRPVGRAEVPHVRDRLFA